MKLSYTTNQGLIEICKCLDPNIYADTGYYLSLDTMARIPKLKGIKGYKTLKGLKSKIKRELQK